MYKWLRAKRVILFNGDELENRRIYIHGAFLIVDTEIESMGANWYNLQCVKQMQGVTADIPEKPQQKQQRVSWDHAAFF